MGAALMGVPILALLLLHLARVIDGPDDEAATLLAFKHGSVAADRTGALASWAHSTSGSPCAWAGVSCVGGRVRALDLSGNSLAGRLHVDALLALPALQSLASP